MAVSRVSALADTGALLALLDEADPWHDACVDAFKGLRLPLLTSAAVLTELFHLLERREHRKAWGLVRPSVTVGMIGDADMESLDALMDAYADRPMDFADATLVHLATRERLSTIFTVDRADFETYRIRGRTRFRILPVEEP